MNFLGNVGADPTGWGWNPTHPDWNFEAYLRAPESVSRLMQAKLYAGMARGSMDLAEGSAEAVPAAELPTLAAQSMDYLKAAFAEAKGANAAAQERVKEGLDPGITPQEFNSTVAEIKTLVRRAGRMMTGMQGLGAVYMSPPPWGGIPEWVSREANPKVSIDWVVGFMEEIPPQLSNPLVAKNTLYLAERQMTQPEWDNPHLRQAHSFAETMFSLWSAGATREQLAPLARAARMHTKAAGFRKTPPQPVSPLRYHGALIFGADDPASARIDKAATLINDAVATANRGDWYDANLTLFKASIIAKMAKESPISPEEEKQAAHILERAIPNFTMGVQEGFEQWQKSEQMRAIREKISPPGSGEELLDGLGIITLREIRAFLTRMLKEAQRRKFNLFAVAEPHHKPDEGASVFTALDTPEGAVRAARACQIAWDKVHGVDPYHDWAK